MPNSEFSANIVAFSDIPGIGLWETGHYRQHLNYNTFLATRTPPIIINVYPILGLVGLDQAKLKDWLEQHELWHEQIRPYANVTNTDLSYFNINDPNSFYNWQQLHNQEHAAEDAAFGFS
jgi:hypothetical protein